MNQKVSSRQSISSRLWMLVHMNEIMKVMSNKNAHAEWLHQIPDETDENGLRTFADDEDLFSETCDVFFGICKRYGKDGVCVPKEEI